MSNVVERTQGSIVADRFVPSACAGAHSSGFLGGVGTSTYPSTTSTAGKFLDYYLQNSATSGDCRGIYMILNLSGGAPGETGRFRTIVSANAAGSGGSIHGCHNAVEFGSTAGSIAGQCAATRSTLSIPNRSVAANGTYYSGLSEIYMDGASSTMATFTAHAIHCFQSAGNTTGMDTVLNCFAINGNTDGTGKMIYSHDHSAGNAAGSIRILVNGSAKYLKFWSAE